MSLPENLNRLADRFFGAIEAGDPDTLIGCYAPGAAIWHNFDQVKMTPAENTEQNRIFFRDFRVRQYRAVQRSFVPADGILQQHIFHLARADGREIDWPGCVLLRIAGDRIVLLEEYVDLASFMQRMG